MCVCGQVFVCVCMSCVLFQLHLSPIEKQVFCQVLSALLRLWTVTHSGGPRLTHLKPIDVAVNVNFCRFNSSPSPTYCCYSRSLSEKPCTFHRPVCVCTCWILSFCAELREQNYCSVWSYVVNKIIVWRSNMLSWQKVVAQWAVQQHKSGKILLTKHGLLTAPSVTFNL